MAENKDYWSTANEQGTVKISEDVVASIAAISTTETEGVGGIYTGGLGSDIAEFLGKKNNAKGIKIRFNGDLVEVDICILTIYGYSIIGVAKEVQKAVHTAIESMTGLHPSFIDIHISGIVSGKSKGKDA